MGQAVYGWIPDWTAADATSAAGRSAILDDSRVVCSGRDDPMSWIAGHRVENSPSWRTAHEVTDALVPDLHSPWFSRLAWTNLYPIAPGDYKGNPAWSEPKFRGVKSVTGTFPGAWVRMEDGAELSRITEWEVLPGSTTVDVEHNRSFAILFGDAEFDVTALWSDRTKGAMSAVDLSMTTDLVQGVIDSFSPDFA